MSGSFSDYSSLCQAIGEKWLDRDDIAEEVKDFVHLAESAIQRTIRFREPQDKVAVGTTREGDQKITLPDDYAEGGLLRWTSDDTLPTLVVSTIDVVNGVQRDLTRALTSQQLRAGFAWGRHLYIGPVPGEVDWELFYKSGVQHLGPSVPTNRILQEHPDLLFYGSLLHSAPFLGDDARIATWKVFYDDAREEVRMAEWRGRYGHGVLHMKPDVQVF